MSAPALQEHPIPQHNNGFRAFEKSSVDRPVRPVTVGVQRDSSTRLQPVTAHVLVLAVGREHLSTALYRQLDMVPASDLVQAIGRVRIRPQDGAGVDLVGVQADGTLAAATIRPPSWTGAGNLDLDHHCHHAHREWIGRSISVGSDQGRRLLWRVDVFSHPRSDTSKGKRIRCGVKYLEEQWRNEARAELAEIVAADQAYRDALSLPLLVLAGR